eukprot:scaffold1394_cov109-Isochrysis_galbana.AAC.16
MYAALPLLTAGALLMLLLLQFRHRGSHQVEPRAETEPDALDVLSFRGCSRYFFDGGSNMGEAVGAFARGHFYQCAMHAPPRNHRAGWEAMGKQEREAVMAPLREPATFCIRSFEAAPPLLPMLRVEEAFLRARGFNVSFIDGALSNRTTADEPRTLWRFARHRWGETAVALGFEEVHVEGRPVAVSSRTVRARSYDLNEVLRQALRHNPAAVIALRLDVEGDEWWMLERLVAAPELLCAVSFLFAEFHSAANAAQRDRLAAHGLAPDAFETLRKRVHAAMEQVPHCRLKLYWRSFWASCGDKQRFEWRVGPQATAAGEDEIAGKEVQRELNVPSARPRAASRRGLLQ